MNTVDCFVHRHIGPRQEELEQMLQKIGVDSLDQLIDQTLPKSIRLESELDLDDGMTEFQYFKKIKDLASKNKTFRSYIGQGYYGTITPAVILRNILENPSWYTSYTPYQAEISQGRLEALLNYQTVISDLTGLELANASLLDESTAAAEAMIMLFNAMPRKKAKAGANVFLVDDKIFPQNLEVIKTRSIPLGIEVKVLPYKEFVFDETTFGALVQYPNAQGKIEDYTEIANQAHENDSSLAVIADILSLAVLTPPAEWGADVVVGSTQRLGIPMGFGGPHAGYFATHEKYKRNIPGRIIGVSKDAQGNTALRMALQTREQHIKRERATSNICTAQALLATMAGMYAVYHGAEGIKNISLNIHKSTISLANNLKGLGFEIQEGLFFDTIEIPADEKFIKRLKKTSVKERMNFYYPSESSVRISLDETVSCKDIEDIVKVFAKAKEIKFKKKIEFCEDVNFGEFERKTDYFTLPIFKRYRSETEMMRYIKKLERKDFSLTHSMISLGSCTMKLNAAVEMLPLSWPEFGSIHPFVPSNQAKGYYKLMKELEEDLKIITGFDAVSFQPNSGASGEYSGLLVIREYHYSRGDENRNVVLIPASAHGTNPASGVMAGMKVIVVPCDDNGNINIESLKQKAEEHKENLAAFMVTYPSTHGVFEEDIIEMNKIIHENGGQVYMDGANMNAQVGLTNPARIGADVCHLNLHKTFAIPHGGGGPGVGPIAVAKHLTPFLPGHPEVKTGGKKSESVVAAAPFGSASILTISHAYIKLLGKKGLEASTKMAILNANYLASSLKDFYEILYTGNDGRVAHEMILECRNFKNIAHLSEADIAKRLMDYGFHAPTLSFPVHGTLMVEPTESESLQELDRFIEAMISIHKEIMEVKNGEADEDDNVLKNSPHTQFVATANDWNHKYEREKATFPLEWVKDNKFWPTVARIDDAFGDRNLVCNCAPICDY